MNDIIILAPMWKDQTVFCIAGGASLTKEQVAYSKGYKVIAVNDAYKIAPWADILYACDSKWWEWHNGCPDFNGYKLQHHSDAIITKPYPDIDIIKSNGIDGFSERMDRIRTGGNGGYQALHIAIQLNPRRIILLGYDMHAKGSKSHWFGEHPNGRLSDKRYDDWLPRFTALQAAADKRNIAIYNCTPKSELHFFKKRTLKELFKCG